MNERLYTGKVIMDRARKQAQKRKTWNGRITLSYGDCQRGDFRGADMSSVDAVETNFESADLSDAVVDDCDFTQTWMPGCCLRHVSAKKSRFVGAYAEDCDFDGSDLRWSIFDGARLSGVQFTNCDLRGCIFVNCDLRDADFAGANTAGASFSACDTEGANLSIQ